MHTRPSLHLPARLAALAALILAAGCATSGEKPSPAATPGPRAADSIYDEWFDPAAIVLPPPPAR